MKKFILSTFILISIFTTAQVRMYEAPSSGINEKSISEIVQQARKQGVEEWEIKILEKNLRQRIANKQKTVNSGKKVPAPLNTTCNLDFEQGNYNSWTLQSGSINGVTLPCNTCANTPGGIANIASLNNSGPTWTNGVDNCSGQTVVNPGSGNNAVCLNDNTAGGKMQKLEQTFQVTSSNTVFSFEYMAVMENPSAHGVNQQPYFLCQVIDSSNNLIPCTYYYAYGSSTNPGWLPANGCSGAYYKPWTTVIVDLAPYVGMNVTLQYIISDCSLGGHFGYVYVDAFCSAPQINAPSAFLCQGNAYTTLTAPNGYNTFNWYGPGIVGPSNQQSVQVNAIGTYSVVVTGGCSGSFTNTLTFNVQYSSNGSPSITVMGNTGLCAPGTTTLTASGASTYTWSTNAGSAMTSSVLVTPSVTTVYTVTAYDSTTQCAGSSFVTVYVDKCVWPGDADENLLVDNADLFPIGLKFGATGTGRSVQGNAWQADYCTNWNDTLSNGTNIKYADCNGNGFIDFNDTFAVHTNYGLTHPAKGINVMSSSSKDIYLTFDKPLYTPGDTMYADVNIGSNANPQSAFYGAAFTLNYDNTKIKAGSEQFYFSNSWVGNINQQKIKLGKIFSSAGKVDASLVRITHTDTSGYGKVATLRIILLDTLYVNEIYFSLVNNIGINSSGTTSVLNGGVDSAAVAGTVGIASQPDSRRGLSVFPNPVTQMLYIRTSAQRESSLIIYDLIGNIVMRLSTTGSKTAVDISSLTPGVYILQAGNERVRFVKE